MHPDPLAPLFDDGFLARLARLRLAVQKRLLSTGGSGRSADLLGGRAEFREHRHYVPGDDPRTIDWNAAARLDQIFVKEFTAAGDLTLRVLVDVSSSMELGHPPKRSLCLQLAAALAYLALHERHAVRLELVDRDDVMISPPFSQLGAFPRLLDWIQRKPKAGPSSGAPRSAGRSLFFALSDFLDQDAASRALRSRKASQSCLVQILSPEEIRPSLQGAVQLIDAESGDPFEMSVGPAERARYEELLEALLENRRALATRHRAGYVLLPSDVSLEEAIFGLLWMEGRLTERR
ncbi:MAG: DUF58 domain-containing protein [Planctomycetota bacterium]